MCLIPITYIPFQCEKIPVYTSGQKKQPRFVVMLQLSRSSSASSLSREVTFYMSRRQPNHRLVSTFLSICCFQSTNTMLFLLNSFISRSTSHCITISLQSLVKTKFFQLQLNITFNTLLHFFGLLHKYCNICSNK